MSAEVVVGFLLLVVLLPLALNEAGELAPWLARHLVRWGARRLGSAAATERYAEEWLANLQYVPGKLTKLTWALGVLFLGVPRLRRQLHRRARRQQPAAGDQGGQASPTSLNAGPTVRRMLLGARLRRLRVDKGITREAAGETIRASEWKIHRLENGQVGFKERDILHLLHLYGVTTPDEVAAFLEMAREANAPGWWHQFGDVLPPWFRAYVDLESAATLIRSYEGQLIPGLLQTADYTRAMLAGAQLNRIADEIERRVQVRMKRQEVLTRKDGPRLWAVVDEAALRRRVGSPRVMRAQVERLIEATRLPNVILQVLPLKAGMHPAMAGAFSLLRFAEDELPDVVYVEHLTSALYLDRRDDVDQYLHVMDRICDIAEPPNATPMILGQVLQDLRR